MIKTTGTEFWRFYNDDTAWPEGAWHDDGVIRVNGEEVDDMIESKFPPDAKVEIDGGVIFLDAQGNDDVAFESHFKKWRKAQNTVTIAVDCPKEKLDALKAAIKAAGGKIV